jgi:hypothetical protein
MSQQVTQAAPPPQKPRSAAPIILALLLLVLAGGGIAWWISHTNSAEYKARRKLAAADQLTMEGELEEAALLYLELAGEGREREHAGEMESEHAGEDGR